MEKIFIIIWILFGLNIEVFLIVMADLWSGVRKAKKTAWQGPAMALNEQLRNWVGTTM